MGFLSGLLGKKKGSKNVKGSKKGASSGVDGFDPSAMKLTDRKTRSAIQRSSKKAAKQFPILGFLKPAPYNLNYLQDYLSQEASKKDGAVREISTMDGQKAYTVIVVDESMFEAMGFTSNKKENHQAFQDLGLLSEQMRHNQIATATLPLNFNSGQIVIIPTKNTLSVLGDFDEFSKYDDGFYWGAYPLDGMDDPATASVSVLSNADRITLAQLNQISVNQTDLMLTEDNRIAEVVDDDVEQAAAQDDQSNDDVYNGNDTADSFDPTDSLNANLNDEQLAVPEAPTIPDAPSQPETNPASAVVPQNTTQPQSAAQASGGSEAMDSQSFNDLMSASGIDTGDTTSVDDINLDDIPDDYSDNNDQSGTNTNDSSNSDAVAPAMTQDEYAGNVANAVGSAQSYLENIDDELNLVIDFSVFDNQFKFRQPPLFTIQPTKQDDHLGNLANTYRQNFNAEIISRYREMEANLRSVYATRARQAANYVAERLNALKGNNSKLAQKAEAIEHRYKQNLQELDTKWPAYVNKERALYDKAKEEFAEGAKQQALVQYDNEHKDIFEHKLQADATKQRNVLAANYMNEKSELENQKIKIAKAAYSSTIVGIMKDINDAAEANYQEISGMFKNFENSIHDTLNENYKGEQERQIAASKALKNDTQIADLEKQLQDQKKKFEEDLKQSKIDADNRVKDLQNVSNDNLAQLKNSYEQQLKNKDSQIETLKNDKTISDERHRKELDTLRKQKEQELQQSRQERANQAKSSDEQMARVQKTGRYISLLGIVTAVLVGLLIGLAWKGHSSSTNNQPAQTQQTTTRQDDSRSQAPTVNYYTGNGGNDNSNSNNSSSSKNSSSSNSNASSDSSSENTNN